MGRLEIKSPDDFAVPDQGEYYIRKFLIALNLKCRTITLSFTTLLTKPTGTGFLDLQEQRPPETAAARLGEYKLKNLLLHPLKNVRI